MFPKLKFKRQKTKVKKIKLQERRECWVCGTTQVEEHHCFNGPNRHISDKYGLTIYLCHEHHTGDTGVHFDPVLRLKVKREAQRKFEAVHGNEEFMRIFGRNYL